MSWLLNTSSVLPKSHELQDVSEPVLFREMFPYTEVPKIFFDGETVPMLPAEDIWITDTTFRDGQQARPPFTVEQITHLYDLLHKLSGPQGIIRQCEFFLYSEKDQIAVKECLARGYKYPEVTGWIRAVPADFELVKKMGLSETGILTSISDYHIFLKLKITRKQALDSFMKIVSAAADAGLKAVRCHYEDVTRADFWGCVVPFTERLMKFQEKSKMKIKIRLCDTMGYGVPWANASLPRSIPKIIYHLKKEFGIPSSQLEWHGHNDFHKVHINSVTAWLSGCSVVNSAIFSLGERTGNSPLESLVVEYASLKGATSGMDLSVITDIADYLRTIGIKIPENYPFAGEKFNVTMAGIHADGMIKEEEIYNIFDTTKILKRPPGVHITDKTGVAGISFWINRELAKRGEKEVDKRDPRIEKIYDWIQKEYNAGRVTAISEEEMLNQFLIHFSQYASKK